MPSVASSGNGSGGGSSACTTPNTTPETPNLNGRAAFRARVHNGQGPKRLSKKRGTDTRPSDVTESSQVVSQSLIGSGDGSDVSLQLANQEAWKEKLEILDGKTRQMYFVYFSHEHDEYNKHLIVDEVLGEVLEQANGAFKTLRLEVMSRVKNLKQRLIEHATELCQIILATDQTAVFLVQDNQLYDYFHKTYTAVNFYKLFRFMEGYIDIERSSKTGKWYGEELYANIMMRVKLHLDAKKKKVLMGENSRQELLKFIDGLALAEEFDGVSMDHFKWINERRSKTPSPSKKETAIPVNGKRFFVAPPPSDNTTVPNEETATPTSMFVDI